MWIRRCCLSGILLPTFAWVAMHNPRGSNNKLSEQSNLVDNPNRLFDSQAPLTSGYQVGDNCKPACNTGAEMAYNPNEPGAMQGKMYYYQGSELYIEWNAKHGCGTSKLYGQNVFGHERPASKPNVVCQEVLQYMCDVDTVPPGTELLPGQGVRDGVIRGATNMAGGVSEPPNPDLALDPGLGYHEPVDYYTRCALRQRNGGLYTADQVVSDVTGATATRQNPLGNDQAENLRHGLECPEERDYYPYWHPTPWHDVAIFTTESESLCTWYQRESQNVAAKGECQDPQFNNPIDCEDGQSTWVTVPSHGESAPVCQGPAPSEARRGPFGDMRYFLWKIPEEAQGNCVLRLRYNVTPGDYLPEATANRQGAVVNGRTIGSGYHSEYFFIDATYNGARAAEAPALTDPFLGGPPIVPNNPAADFLNLGEQFKLRLNVDTTRMGHTYEDRSHTFEVRPIPAEARGYRILNFNIRGRRGTQEQVYPSVEYSFVPKELKMEEDFYLHFQWVGSDANELTNTGNGRPGTDRNNLIQTELRADHIPKARGIMNFLVSEFPSIPYGLQGATVIDQFAYLNQTALAPGATVASCDPSLENILDETSLTNCAALNGASAYFDGGLLWMTSRAEFYIMSSRNEFGTLNDITSTVTILPRRFYWVEIAAIILGVIVFGGIAAYIGAAFYALRFPKSFLFSKKYRPGLVSVLASAKTIQEKEKIRKDAAIARLEEMRKLDERDRVAYDGPDSEAPQRTEYHEVVKPWSTEKQKWCMKRCKWCAEDENRAFVILFYGMVLGSFLVGVGQNWKGGFQENFAFEVAKGFGTVLDFTLAIILIPVCRSIQAGLRNSGGAQRGWIPMDEPIELHIIIAYQVGWASVFHTLAHIVHAVSVDIRPKIQLDPLGRYVIDQDDMLSGRNFVETLTFGLQYTLLNSRLVGWTGVWLVVHFGGLFFTAWTPIRRGTSQYWKAKGGFTLFWKWHMSWPLAFAVTMLHSPTRFWMWCFFPFIIVAMDRIIYYNQEKPYAALIKARSLPSEVLHLMFEVPEGWKMSVGQYIRIWWENEWHPFTLTSAPEEKVLSLHIKSGAATDWCCALRKFLTIYSPHIARGGDPKEVPDKVDDWTSIDFYRCVDLNSKMLYGRPIVETTKDGPEAELRQGLTHQATLTQLVEEKNAKLPDDAVVMKIAGPYGAPAMRCWEFDTIMVVGTGIGVTPFASLLRSISLKAQHRQAILSAVCSIEEAQQIAQGPSIRLDPVEKKDGEGGEWKIDDAPDFMKQFAETRKSLRAEAGAGAAAGSLKGSRRSMKTLRRVQTGELSPVQELADMVSEIITYPDKVYFYWVVRSQKEFDWFAGLLSTAVAGPAREILQINIFMTAGVDGDNGGKQIPCVDRMFTSRPAWPELFKEVKDAHKGDHIGVFLCGAPAVGVQLHKNSLKFSDPPGTPDATKFSFYAESF